ncbi:MAG: dihydroorotate dehydrogenase electron transfer subunit [Candidatus Latescibacteria bacterium]|nr:dihydroorotate dehydrogenase electron transfer subunit [Candidatus Latescibacterota bacterium]
MTPPSSPSPVFQVRAEVVANRQIGPGLYWIDLAAPEIVEHARPGHFVHLVVSDTTPESPCPVWMQYTPLLRRPFSIAEHDRARGTFSLIYRVVGGGTHILSTRRAGESLDVLGPLGQTFVPIQSGRPVVMIAGGVGIAPFFFLAQEAIQAGRARPQDMTVLFGAATASLLSGSDKFRAMGIDVSLATDDGTAGFHGFVTVLLEDLLRQNPSRCAYLYVCGPTPMMRRSAALAKEAGLLGQMSLEGIMPCGVGVCMACVVPCVRPPAGTVYERVCVSGPVFDLQEVILP